MIAAVSNNSDAFRYASAALKRDRSFVLSMMREVELAGYALDFVTSALKADREVVLAAVMSSEGAALELCAEALQADREFVMDAVAADEHALECASEAMRRDREVVVTAVSAHGLALVYAEDELKADKEVRGANGAGRAGGRRRRRRSTTDRTLGRHFSFLVALSCTVSPPHPIYPLSFPSHLISSPLSPSLPPSQCYCRWQRSQ